MFVTHQPRQPRHIGVVQGCYFGERGSPHRHRFAPSVFSARQLCLGSKQAVVNLAIPAHGQLAAHWMHLCDGTRNHLKKGSAVAFEFLRADPPDPCHLVKVQRAFLGHLDKGFVVEHDVGGAAELFCKEASFRLERREKRCVFFADHLADFRAGALSRFDTIAAQINRRLATQDWPRPLGHAQRAVTLRVGPH